MIDWKEVKYVEPFFTDRYLFCRKHNRDEFIYPIPEPRDFHEEYTKIKNIVYPGAEIKIRAEDQMRIKENARKVKAKNDAELMKVCSEYGIEFSASIATILQNTDTKEIFIGYKAVVERYGFEYTTLNSINCSIKYAVETHGSYKGIPLRYLYQKQRFTKEMEQAALKSI